MRLIEHNSAVDKFAALVNEGIQCWVSAGEIVAKNMDSDPEFIDKVNEKYPQFTHEILMRFEQIGRKSLIPELLVSDCPGYTKLRRLPYEYQAKLLNSGVETLIRTPSGWDSLKIAPINLTRNQADLVFAKDRIRSIAEQRAVIEGNGIKKYVPTLQSEMPYRIRGGRLFITDPVELTKQDLKKILAQMK